MDRPISDEQALFLASLPDAFSEFEYAIRVHAFVNRVREISVGAGREAIEFGSRVNFVDVDPEGRVRLAEWLRKRRNALQESDTYYEVAVAELSKVILEHAATQAGA